MNESFLNDLYVGGGNGAVASLRNRLVSVKGSKTRLTVGYTFGIAIKAFRSFFMGTTPGVLKWAYGEEMPSLDDLR